MNQLKNIRIPLENIKNQLKKNKDSVRKPKESAGKQTDSNRKIRRILTRKQVGSSFRLLNVHLYLNIK